MRGCGDGRRRLPVGFLQFDQGQACGVLFANQAGQGGAVYIAGSQFVHGTAQLTNCTLASNSAAVGASIYADTTTTQPAALTVVNSILWQDLPTDPLNVFGAGGTVSITYSCVKGGYVGVGNIAVDPQFVDRVNGDLRLLVVSPCIDAGNTNLVDLVPLVRYGLLPASEGGAGSAQTQP